MKKLISFVVGLLVPAFIMAGGMANSAEAQENSNAWSESCVAAKKRRTERRGSSPAGLFDQGKSGIRILRVLLELVPSGESARLNDLRTLQKETPPKKG